MPLPNNVKILLVFLKKKRKKLLIVKFSRDLNGGQKAKHQSSLNNLQKYHIQRLKYEKVLSETSGPMDSLLLVLESYTHIATHLLFMILALKPNTANTTRVASTEVKKLIKDTKTASKWQLLSRLL